VVVLAATQANEQWAMDFMRDTLADGRAFRALTLIDTCTREFPVIEVDVSLGAERGAAVHERLRATRGLPQRITVDDGPEFQSKALDTWAHHHHVQLVYSRPGKLVDNTFIEAFNWPHACYRTRFAVRSQSGSHSSSPCRHSQRTSMRLPSLLMLMVARVESSVNVQTLPATVATYSG
jgi:transposase InsO family protein